MFISPTPNKYLLVLFAQKSPYHTTPHCIAEHHNEPQHTTHTYTGIHTHITEEKGTERNGINAM